MKNINKKIACGLLLLVLSANISFSQDQSTVGGNASTGSSTILCGAGHFSNVSNVNSASTSDWTSFSLAAGAGCQYWIHSTLNGTAPAGTFAGFRVRTSDLTSMISGIQLRTYQSGVLQETVSAAGLTAFTDVSGSYILFQTTKAYNELRLMFSGLALVAYNMDIFYGFGTVRYPGTVLPIKFTDVASERSEALVTLRFQLFTNTSTKIEIERSTDAQNFAAIATLPFQNSSRFVFNDNNPFASYYRVSAADSSGKYYSKIIRVEAVRNGVQARLVKKGSGPIIQLNTKTQEKANYFLADEQGRIMLQERRLIVPKSEIALPANLQVGRIYFFTLVTENNERTTLKWVQ